MTSALKCSGLVELNDTEHLGITYYGERQPQRYPGREKQSAKDYYKAAREQDRCIRQRPVEPDLPQVVSQHAQIHRPDQRRKVQST